MKFLIRLCALLLVLASLSPAWGQLSSLKVSEIKIEHIGPPATTDELIRANIRVKVGDPYLRAAVDDDVRNLYATGLFYHIRVVDDITNGNVRVTYFLQGKPRLTDVKFLGNKKFTNLKLQKKLTSKIGEPLDEQKLFTDTQEIQKMYQKAGYPGTTVKYVPNIDETTGRGTVVFEINESPKIKITSIEFVGAKAFTERELRKAIKTKKRGFFSWLTSSGVFKEEQFEDDLEKLREFYRDKGYIDFEIKDVQRELTTPRTMKIRFILYEGSQYKVGSVQFVGNHIFSNQEITSALREQARRSAGPLKKPHIGPNGVPMDVGDIFTPKGLTQDETVIEDFYGSRGYIDPRRVVTVKIPNTETGTMDLEFRINEGQKNYIEKIEIRGNTKTKDRVIRRELAVSPGEVFDMVRVKVTRQRMINMDYFEKVDARPEPTDVPGRQNLVIGVEEKGTGSLTAGAGFNSVESGVLFAEMFQRNFDLFHPPTFTGGGQTFRLSLKLGTQFQDYLVSFEEPWFLERKLVFGIDLYHQKKNFQSLEDLYNEQRTGARVGFRRPLLNREQLIGSIGYSIENVGIDFNGNVTDVNGIPMIGPNDIPLDLLEEAGDTLVSKVDMSIAYDTRNASIQLPDSGQRTEFTATVAGPMGGEKDFYKLELQTEWYFKGFAEGHVFEILGSMGVAQSYGRSDSVPFYDRWYLGGVGSLRGYRYRSVSPREPDSLDFHSNEPIGGNTFWFGSAEYSIPIIPAERGRADLRFAMFYDFGNVSKGSYAFPRQNYNDNVGFGIRLNIPRLAPLRLDYGIPITHDKHNSGQGRFQFSVGFTRNF